MNIVNHKLGKTTISYLAQSVLQLFDFVAQRVDLGVGAVEADVQGPVVGGEVVVHARRSAGAARQRLQRLLDSSQRVVRLLLNGLFTLFFLCDLK